MSEGLDITKLVREVMNDTMERAFYLQTKAFFEKNNEHINEIARLKTENDRLRKAGDAMANTLDAHARIYNDCPSVEAESWWIAKNGGCP